MPAAGGTGAIPVRTERECQWTAQPDVGWLSITSGASGQGDGTVQFNAGANIDPVARTGGIMLNGQRAPITQAAADCHFDLAQNAASFPPVGGNGTVDVRASSQLCSWTAVSDVDWITIKSGATGKGSASVTYTVAATTGPPRAGTLTIAGLRVSVTQGEGCTYAIAPSSYSVPPSGGSSVIVITAGPGCPWTASSNDNWISVSADSGNGTGTVGFTVAPSSGPPRTGTLIVAGQTFTVTQSAGCNYSVSPLTNTVDSTGGTRTVTVSVAGGCPWSAVANDPWITINGGSSGNGPGTVTFTAASTTGPGRTGTLTVANQTVTVTQGQGCTYAISPDSQSVPATGGTGTVTVTAGNGCTWTAGTTASSSSWITITSGAAGSGNGTVNYTVAATSGPGRSGVLTIAGRSFTVNQGQGCTFTLSSAGAPAPAAGGPGSFDVRTADGCAWTATSNATWITITSAATGTGNGTVRYSAAANTGTARSGTITVNGQTFTVTQDVGCTYSIAPASQNLGSGGGNVSVAVTAPAGCAWTVTSNASWIGISSSTSGSGNGTVQLVVGPNTDAVRTGTVTIAGQTFTVTQASGCTYSIAPASQNVPAGGGTGSFAVNASGTCAWTAAANVPWITVTSAPSGNGNGTVQFSAAANTAAARSGTITVAGQTFMVTQDGGCAFTVTPDTFNVPSAAGPQNVTVTAPQDCPWSAVSNAPWITIPTPAGGFGTVNMQLAIDANTGPARTGTATIAGHTVTVNQDNGCTYSIAPTSQTIGVGGGPGSVTVTTSGSCTWTASSGVPWITITSGSSGTGGGTVQFTVDANSTGSARTGTLTIAGQPFTVSQNGM